MRRRTRLALSLGAAALVLTLLLAGGGVNPIEGLKALDRLSFGVYLLALGLHVVTYSLRAARFQLLMPAPARPSFRHALTIAAAHNMASYVLPAKTGEASLVLYLKMQCGTATSVGLAALLVSRFLDGAALSSGLAVACLAMMRAGEHPALVALGPLSVALVGLTLLFLLLSLRSDLLLRAIAALLRWLRVHHLRLGQRLLERSNALALALRSAAGPKRLGAAALITVPMWFTVFGFFALLGGAMGLPAELTFLDRAFGASLATLFNLLPLNAAAGVGTQELGWVMGFQEFLGVDYQLALSTGIGVHLVQLFNVVALGLIAHLAMGVMPRWTFTEEDEPSG